MAGNAVKSTKSLSGFTPLAIAGCSLWLDGRDPAGTGVRPANGASVSTWVDKSGSGNSPTSSSGVYPTYNTTSNAVVWAGGDARLTFPTTIANSVVGRSFSVFIVSRRTVGTEAFFFRGTALSTNTNLLIGHLNSTTWRFAFFGNDLDATVTTYSAGESASIVCSMYSKPGRSIFLNGAISASSSDVNASDLASWAGAMIGGSGTAAAYNGVVYEVLIYNTSLTTSTRQQIEGYLAWRWGMTSTLPTAHPYKLLPPFARPFQPTDIDGCALWLDAADATTFTLSGSNITTWADKSGNARDATQYNTGFATYNGSNRVTITPTGQLSSTVPAGTFSAGVSGFVVFNSYGSNAYDTLINRTSAGGLAAPFDSWTNSATNTTRFIGNGTASYSIITTSDAPFRTTSVNTYGFVIAANTTWNESINGTYTTLTTSPNSNIYTDTGSNIAIGTRADKYTTASIYVYEVLVFNSALSTTQRQQVEGYLADKWSLRTFLPPAVTPGFSPTQISGCRLWLDAGDASTLTLSGSNVTQWNDKSGNGFNATIPVVTGIVNPVYTSGTVRFQNNSDGMLVAGNNFVDTNLVFIIALRLGTQPTNAANRGILSTDVPGQYGRALGLTSTTNYQVLYRNGFADTGVAWTQNWAVVGLQFTGTSSTTFYLNGNATSVAASTGTNTNTAGLKIGCYNYTESGIAPYNTNFDVGEILIYNTVLTTTQRQQIEAYLANRWGPFIGYASHPFKRAPTLTTPFSPRQISGCSLWLDAADASTLTLSGSNVTQWNDKSGNGRNTTGGVSPTYNSSTRYILFNGSTQYFTLPTGAFPSGNTPYSIFIVAFTTNAANPQWILAGGTESSNALLGVLFYTTNAVWHSWWINEYAANNTITNSASAILNVSYATTRRTIVNGGTATTNSPGASRNNPTSPNYIGTRPALSQFLNGGIGEILIFDSEIAQTQRQRVEGYLAAKWSLTGNLPTTHPYKKITP